MKTALVCGGSGFIGTHLIKRLKFEGYWVRSVDRKKPEFEPSEADETFTYDLRIAPAHVFFTPIQAVTSGPLPREQQNTRFDEVYQLACDMGGMGFLGDSKKDAEVLADNARINLRVLEHLKADVDGRMSKVFFASSACVYSQRQVSCREIDAYPVECDLEYGYEKIFSERLYLAHGHRYAAQVRIARFHNIFGPLGTWTGGREKAPAAICRKVAEARDNTAIQIWGDGKQTRSFLYVDEAIEGVRRLMASDFQKPINIGSSEMVSIDDLAEAVIQISGKQLAIEHTNGPVGVRGRNSDNTLIETILGWKPSQPLALGLRKTYQWIEEQVDRASVPV